MCKACQINLIIDKPTRTNFFISLLIAGVLP
jgi:hypothetical protein